MEAARKIEQEYGGRVFHVSHPQKKPVKASTNGIYSMASAPQERKVQRAQGSNKNVFSNLLGIERENPEFNRAFSAVIKLEDIANDAEKKKSIIDNAWWVINRTQEVVDQGYRNLDGGREAWHGLQDDMGLPIHHDLRYLTGNYKKQQYYHNAFSNHLAKAIIMAIEHDADIEFYFDVDGTITDKSKRPHATRAAQPLEQVHALNKAVEALSKQLGVKIYTNTNRPPETTKIGVRGKGLDTPLIEGEHDSPWNEIVSRSPQSRLDAAGMVSVSALSTAYREGEETFIHPKVFLTADILKHLGSDFINEYIKKPMDKYGFVVLEPKNINKFVLDAQRINGRTHGAWVTKIRALKEEIVGVNDKQLSTQELQQRYERLRDAIIKNVEEGMGTRPFLEARKEKLQRNINQLERGSNNLRQIKQLEQELKEVNLEMASYIELPGYGSNENFLTYTDTLGKEQKCINYWKCLLENPQFFYREVTQQAELVAVCAHISDCRNIPHPEAIDEAIETLRQIENKEGVRDLVRKAHVLAAKEHSHGTRLQHPDAHINNFINKARSVYEEKGEHGLIKWKLLKHLELHYSPDELKEHSMFDLGDRGLEFKDDFDVKWHPHGSKDLAGYLQWLKSEFKNEGKLGQEVIEYIDSAFSEDFLITFQMAGEQAREEYFCPDMLFCVNYQVKYNEDSTYIPVISFEDKRTPIKPWGQGYHEALKDLEKSEILPGRERVLKRKKIIFTFGDSKSDLAAHNKSLHLVSDFDGVKVGGGAVQIYNHINKSDYIKEAINRRVQEVEAALKGNYNGNFNADYAKSGIWGLQKVQGGYRKVIGVKGPESKIGSKGECVYFDDKTYSEQDIKKEIWNFLESRVYAYDSPVEQVLSLAYATSWLTGQDVRFNWNDFDEAHAAYKKNPKTNNKLVNYYRTAIEEAERSKYRDTDIPHFGAYFEYVDEKTGEKYYRLESDKTLATKKGKCFQGDEKKLVKRAIRQGVKEDKFGVFVYEDTKQVFDDAEFLTNKCCEEETVLPSSSPQRGIFSSNGFLKLIGGGSVATGQKNLRKFITKMPNLFSSTLAACGGLLSFGGLIRLASKLSGGEGQEKVYKFGYWMSQIVRAGSAVAGAMRGMLNVNKYYEITIGEIGNALSAVLLPNGPKHIGYALSNLFLLTGRGIQNAQRQLSSNILTQEEINAGKPVKGIFNPRSNQVDLTRLNTEKVKLPISRAVTKAGLPPVLGHFVSSLASTTLTSWYMLKQIVKNPKLIFQMKKRVSDKSGNTCYTIPSTGHLFVLSGVLGGISAVGASIFGRMEKFGEVGESGFNKIGRWLTSFATFVQAPPIILNGLEIAANQNGLPRMTRGLDGKTIKYNPERAGYGQAFAGAMFGLLSWFPLDKDWAASLFDMFALGPYFGLPKMKMGVSEEDKMNSLELAENMLFENDQFFLKRPKEQTILSFPAATPQRPLQKAG